MSLFWHSSREERGRLVRTLYDLGPTTVPGLSAALSWPEKRTERLVRELARSGEGGVVFHSNTRRVEIPKPRAAVVHAEERPVMPHGPHGPTPVPPSLPAPSTPTLSSKWGGQSICPQCSGMMEPTAHAEALVCRDCGHITSVPRTSRGPVSESPSPSPGVVASSGTLAERKQQEMFAAYVTSRPVVCPKCRTTLQHRGLGSYGCPSCGHTIRFAANGLPPQAAH